MSKRLIAIALFIGLVTPIAAVGGEHKPVPYYVLTNRHAKCRAHYVKRTLHVSRRKRVKVHGTWKFETVRERAVACVYVAPKTPTTSPKTPTSTVTPAPSQSLNPIYGLTVDDISNIQEVVSMEESLPVRPTTRVVFDWRGATSYEPPSYYESAIESLDRVSDVMGELLDSSYESGVSTATYSAMVQSYLSTLGSTVNIWEIGNEVNGNWTGPYPTVAANIDAAYTDVSADGYASALTLYANEYGPDNCGDGLSELTPIQFSERYVPASVRDGLSYVFESYYPTQCGSTFPTNAQVAAEMEALHALYPNALLGFGEIGLPEPVTNSTLASAEQVMSWAYGLNPGLSYFVGGYFWWYGDEDLVPATKALYPVFLSALFAEQSALG
jgi:hypothetical protein